MLSRPVPKHSAVGQNVGRLSLSNAVGDRVPVLRTWALEAGLKVLASHSVWAAEKTLDPTTTGRS